MPVTIFCAYCGKPKKIKPSKVQERNFCNLQCLAKLMKTERLGENNPRYVPPKKRLCANCKKEIEVFPCQNNWRKKFCNHDCRVEYNNKKTRGICKVCNKEFKKKHKSQKVCSMQCWGKLSSINQQREKSPRWKGGDLVDYGPDWNRIAKQIRKRDNYICQHCKRKRKKQEKSFHVHHIIPLREFNGDYLSANKPKNLITLCPSCHTKAEFGTISIQLHLY